MDQALRKIGSLCIAVLMLVSTVSWTIEKHYCLGSLIDIAFFQDAEGCCTQPEAAQNPAPIALAEDSCCSEEVIAVAGLDSLTFPDKDRPVVPPLFFMLPPLYAQHYVVVPRKELLSPYKNYPQPFLVRDVQVLNEIFLI